MANKISENTELTLDLKTLIIIVSFYIHIKACIYLINIAYRRHNKYRIISIKL